MRDARFTPLCSLEACLHFGLDRHFVTHHAVRHDEEIQVVDALAAHAEAVFGIELGDEEARDVIGLDDRLEVQNERRNAHQRVVSVGVRRRAEDARHANELDWDAELRGEDAHPARAMRERRSVEARVLIQGQ
jgi:hypothetical protein